MTLSLVVFFLTNNVSIIAILKSTYLNQVDDLSFNQFSKEDKKLIANYLWRTINFGGSENTKGSRDGSYYFSSKEIAHLKDVSGIFKIVRIACLASLIVVILLSIYFFKKKKNIAKFFLYGGLLVIIFGLIVAITFDKSFLLFHIISFNNDLWLLNPETDLLINIFPEKFFLNNFILVIVLSIIELLVGYLIASRVTHSPSSLL
jgi:integral membrane protein (TIGR01906 family)